MARALVALTHAASQLIYRWLPPPTANLALPEPEALAQRGWQELIQAPAVQRLLPWLPRFLATRDPDGSRLASTLEQHRDSLLKAGGCYVLYGDADYPALLAQIAEPPLALTVLGDLALLKRPAIAVVGSRKASALALRGSFAVGRALAEAGVLVVSGGAFGCDAAAHQGVLAAGGDPAPAACVFACGLATLYPRGNASVFKRLEQTRALLLSERLWDAPCLPPDFPTRNRIIAGLAGVTVLMQAAVRSGAMVTARLALDQGREVLVFRHPEDDMRAAGGTGLLSDGAAGFGSLAELMKSLRFSRWPGDGQNGVLLP